MTQEQYDILKDFSFEYRGERCYPFDVNNPNDTSIHRPLEADVVLAYAAEKVRETALEIKAKALNYCISERMSDEQRRAVTRFASSATGQYL